MWVFGLKSHPALAAADTLLLICDKTELTIQESAITMLFATPGFKTATIACEGIDIMVKRREVLAS